MRGILFSLMALLVMASVAIADPVLSVVPDNYYVGTGYKSFKVQVAGTNVNTLSKFTIDGSRSTGDVYQVFTETGGQTPWDNGTTPHDALDSYVLFGSLWEPGIIAAPLVTTETIVTSGGTNQGMGTLTNHNDNGTPTDLTDDKMDAFLRLANGVDYQVDTPETGIDVLRLVLPDGASATVNATILTCDQNPQDSNKYTLVSTFNLSTVVKCPLDGDANGDGIVSGGDAGILGGNWYKDYGSALQTFATGDFNGDGEVTGGDAGILGANWYQQADWYGTAEGAAVAVPEPGTLILLVLGSLCLVGYRLGK